MPIPAIILGIVVSTLLGAVFHLWRGGGAGRLLLFLVLGWLGFWLGELVAARLDWSVLNLGALHLGPALLVGLIFLFLGSWLASGNTEKRPERRRPN